MPKELKPPKFNLNNHICEKHNRAHLPGWTYLINHGMCPGCPFLKCCPVYFRDCDKYNAVAASTGKGGNYV